VIWRGRDLTETALVKREERVAIIDTDVGILWGGVEKNQIQRVTTNTPNTLILRERDNVREWEGDRQQDKEAGVEPVSHMVDKKHPHVNDEWHAEALG
jgi:hypothetical protein